MNHSQALAAGNRSTAAVKPRRRSILRIVGFCLAGLLVVLLFIGGLSYYLYYSPKPADLPCRGCVDDARAVNVNGFDLYYRSVGSHNEKPPVVLLHGGPGMSSQTFKKGFDFLAESGWQVIYYDQRGSGNSQIKPDSELYTVDQLVEELEALRRDVIGSQQIILVGHSAGGALAQRYALAYPQHVARMVLVCALPADGNFSLSGPLMDTFYSLPYLLTGNLPPSDPQQADLWAAELGYKSSLSRLYDPTHPETTQDFGYMSFAVNRELTRSTFGGSFDERLRQLKTEALIMYGEADHSDFTGVQAAERMHSTLANSTVVRFDRSGHWPYLEEPERFRQVLHDFLVK